MSARETLMMMLKAQIKRRKDLTNTILSTINDTNGKLQNIASDLKAK
jgi:hypothetical protein